MLRPFQDELDLERDALVTVSDSTQCSVVVAAFWAQTVMQPFGRRQRQGASHRTIAIWHAAVRCFHYADQGP